VDGDITTRLVGSRVFGLTLRLCSLSLCDLLCCSLVDVRCESYRRVCLVIVESLRVVRCRRYWLDREDPEVRYFVAAGKALSWGKVPEDWRCVKGGQVVSRLRLLRLLALVLRNLRGWQMARRDWTVLWVLVEVLLLAMADVGVEFEREDCDLWCWRYGWLHQECQLRSLWSRDA